MITGILRGRGHVTVRSSAEPCPAFGGRAGFGHGDGWLHLGLQETTATGSENFSA
jgi:hypothetical protein